MFTTVVGMMPGALDGIRVVDLSINVLGPMATQFLGDMGADVIKVEPPLGDPIRRTGASRSSDMASFFLNLNRNKRSIVVDLKRPECREVLMRLVEGADVFVHSMRAPAARRLGIDYPSVRARRPTIIYAAGTGYNRNGRRADRPAYDDVIQGASGVAFLMASVAGEPRYVPMVLADKLCGMALGSAIAVALVHQARTGQGQEVAVPMFDTLVAFNLVEHMWFGSIGEAERGLGYPRLLTPNRRPHATRDGYICVLASTETQWRRLFEVIERPELSDDPRFADRPSRTANIDALYAILARRLKTQGTAEWCRRLDAADIPNGPVNNLPDLLNDPDLHETGFFRRLEHPIEGRITLMTNPTELSGTPASLRLPPPRIGEHTRSILAEIGYDAVRIEEIAGAVDAD